MADSIPHQHASDDEIIHYCAALDNKSEVLSEVQGGGSVVKLSDDAVVKFGFGVSMDEAKSQRRAYDLLDANIVRVPRVYRFFSAGGVGYLVMEYIKGHSLDAERDEDCIPKIVRAIKHFRQIRANKPGALSGGICRGLLWSDYDDFRPTSTRDIEQYFNFSESLPIKLDLNHGAMTFCHLDIADRNIVVQEDGSICFLDWASAGFYPAFFEIGALRLNVRPSLQDFNSKILGNLDWLSDDERAQSRSLELAVGLNERYSRRVSNLVPVLPPGYAARKKKKKKNREFVTTA